MSFLYMSLTFVFGTGHCMVNSFSIQPWSVTQFDFKTQHLNPKLPDQQSYPATTRSHTALADPGVPSPGALAHSRLTVHIEWGAYIGLQCSLAVGPVLRWANCADNYTSAMPPYTRSSVSKQCNTSVSPIMYVNCLRIPLRMSVRQQLETADPRFFCAAGRTQWSQRGGGLGILG